MLDFAAAKATGLLTWLTPDVHEAYIALNMAQSLHPEARQAHLVFTPLHGTANTTVGAVLRQAGFQVDLVAAQACLTARFRRCRIARPIPKCRNRCSRAWSWRVR